MTRTVSASLLLLAVAASSAYPAELAYLSGRRVYSIQEDGSAAHPICNTEDYEGAFCWSADGTRLIIGRTRGAPCSWLAVINADGTNDTKVATGGCFSYDPRWLPDGLRFVFGQFCGTPAGLCINTIDNTGYRYIVKLPEDGPLEIERLDVSRDGLRAAYITGWTKVPHRLYVVPIAGGEPKLLSEQLAYPYSAPSFSPDGLRIAFVGGTDQDPDIHTIGIDGQDDRRLTSSPGQDFGPAWSPDGKTIAFVTGPERARKVALMDSDGSNIRLLPEPVAIACGGLAWSSDSTKLAFAAGPEQAGRIYIADCQTLSSRRLTNGPGNDCYPQWRPVPPR